MATTRTIKAAAIQNIDICRSPERYCAHPRQGGLYNFGNGELALIHHHAPWPYKEKHPMHGFGQGYKSDCVWLLQRSLDGGLTWPEEHNVTAYDETVSFEDKHARLHPESPEREQIDLTASDSIVVFGRTWLGATTEEELTDFGELGKDRDIKPGKCRTVCIALRSADRGKTWEQTPTVIPGPGKKSCEIIGHNTLLMDDGSMLMTASVHPPSASMIYATDDNGLTWEYLSTAGRMEGPMGSMSYPGLIRLPDGRVQCYMLSLFGDSHGICMTETEDLYNWTAPRHILHWGNSPWMKELKVGQHSTADLFPTAVHYRSPWPLLLDDGRIIVTFGRRKPPYGIGAVVSEDEGRTWSDDIIIRCDASGTDLGYNLITQLDDGSLFAAYYFMQQDGNPHGGSRFIGGTKFRV